MEKRGATVRLGFDGINLRAELCGEIDQFCCDRVRREIDREIYSCRPRVLLLDFEKVGFVDSSGLGLVMGRLNVCRDIDCQVRVIGAGERMKRIFAMAGVERFGPALSIL